MALSEGVGNAVDPDVMLANDWLVMTLFARRDVPSSLLLSRILETGWDAACPEPDAVEWRPGGE